MTAAASSSGGWLADDLALALRDDLALALRAADVADGVSLPGYERRGFSVERKADHSEVTVIDRATETAISDMLRAQRPDYSLYGEEHGVVGPREARRQWVVDPIDGTSNFVRGVPVWATLIALVDDGVPVLGVVSAPALQRRWWAARGLGAHGVTAHGAARELRVSTTNELRRASASITVSESWHAAGKTVQLDRLQRGVARLRNYGDFWQHMLVAEGAVDFEASCTPGYRAAKIRATSSRTWLASSTLIRLLTSFWFSLPCIGCEPPQARPALTFVDRLSGFPRGEGKEFIRLSHHGGKAGAGR